MTVPTSGPGLTSPMPRAAKSSARDIIWRSKSGVWGARSGVIFDAIVWTTRSDLKDSGLRDSRLQDSIKETIDVLLRIENHQVIDLLADARITDRQAEFFGDSYCNAAFCRAVE